MKESLPTIDDLRTDAEKAFLLTLTNAKVQVNETLKHFRMPQPVQPAIQPVKLCHIDWSSLEHAEQEWTHITLTLQSLAILLLVVVALSIGVVACVGVHVNASRGWFSSAWWIACAYLVLQLVHDEVGIAMIEILDRFVSKTFDEAIAGVIEGVHETKIDDVIEQAFTQVSRAWNDKERQVNQALFGWANASAADAHALLNGVWDLVSDTVNDVLSYTPLHDPVEQFAKCVIGNKLNATDHIVSWLQTHARVTLPAWDLNTLVDVNGWMQNATSHIKETPLHKIHMVLATERHLLVHDRFAVLITAAAGVGTLGMAWVLHSLTTRH